jgi:hypothetical protein
VKRSHHSKKQEPDVTIQRHLLAVLAIGVFSIAMVLFAKLGPLPAAIAGVCFTVPLCSLGEWWVHGILYHSRVPGFARIRKIHHAGHHFALFPPTRYVQSGPYEFMRVNGELTPFRMSQTMLENAMCKWGQVALHFAVGIPLILAPAWLASKDEVFFISVISTLAFISWLLAYVHGVIHTPRDRWVERMRWFQWLDRHHYIHHIDLGSNINFLLPLCDLLLGTHRMEMTDEERRAHPSFELAKPRPRRPRAASPASTPATSASSP